LTPSVERSAASILLSTEAGGEGRNFQFCHLLVNYDLPWNPMRVEQRIGRVDRIGQDHTVQVFNFWVKGTVEERVLDVLERRINVFEDTVGGSTPSSVMPRRDLKKIFKLGGENATRRSSVREQIERRSPNAREAEEKLRDFIMETKSYSHEIASMLAERVSPITAADQERFILRLLKDVSTAIDPHHDGTCTVVFREPFVSDYPEHVKGDDRRRVVSLRRDVKPDSDVVEFLALGHPIVDDLIARATDPSYPGTATAFRVDEVAGVAPTRGWLIVYELGVPALREVRELTPYFVHEDGRIDRALGQTLLERAASFPKDAPIDANGVPADELADALEATESAAHTWLQEMEATAGAESRRQYEREKAKLDAYFDYRDQAALDRLASSQAVLASVEAATDAETRRIVPVWRANVERDRRLIAELAEDRIRQLSQLEHRVSGGGDSQLVCVAWVEIGAVV
jgi:ATP-dependent helicase HepA